jgi:hypothetical protein
MGAWCVCHVACQKCFNLSTVRRLVAPCITRRDGRIQLGTGNRISCLYSMFRLCFHAILSDRGDVNKPGPMGTAILGSRL